MQKFTVVDCKLPEQKPFVGIIIGNVGGGLRILNLTDGSTTHYLLDDRFLKVAEDQVTPVYNHLVRNLERSGYLYEYKGGKVYGIYRATGADTLDVLMDDDTIYYNLEVIYLLNELKYYKYQEVDVL